jgi:hypothetical protein
MLVRVHPESRARQRHAQHNTLEDSDAMEIVTNQINNLRCQRNTPALHIGDSGGA